MTQQQLEKLNTKRLIALLKSVRVKERIAVQKLTGGNFKKEIEEKVKPLTDYAETIKNILSTRENIEKGTKNV